MIGLLRIDVTALFASETVTAVRPERWDRKPGSRQGWELDMQQMQQIAGAGLFALGLPSYCIARLVDRHSAKAES